MSSGYGPVGRIEAMDRETTGVVSICVRECWTSSEDFVELVIDLPDGAVIDMSDGERVLLDMGHAEARQLAEFLLQAAGKSGELIQ
ncbi:MAG: hypothetical protein DME91_09680 [Verrucomicrobia bacterium]|nr:MAG: hypothetical protein DME91_09680 [Verrucomicrobiota bacterium]PYK64932.1 MAG: hypothetical protein DME50_10925 [Verrucomicrobiota bacterium]